MKGRVTWILQYSVQRVERVRDRDGFGLQMEELEMVAMTYYDEGKSNRDLRVQRGTLQKGHVGLELRPSNISGVTRVLVYSVYLVARIAVIHGVE